MLQEGQFEPVGEDCTRRANVRLIAATNRNLEEEVEVGCFRWKLFFRLSVFPLRVSPLRDRLDDIPVLASSFLEQAARRMHCATPALSGEDLQELTTYPWPGNIRKLQNVVEVVLAGGKPVRFNLRESAPPVAAGYKPATPVSTRAELVKLERTSIVNALKRSGGKIYGPGGTAEILDIRPTTLASRIAVLKIKRR